ncbi:hydrolase, partial [Hyphodiscus hymeniophilus]
QTYADMRFLCLHGMGTSGAIFSSQTAAFRSKLNDRFIFDFVDAPHNSPPAWGVEAFFPPPNYTFWQSIDPGDIAEAHQWLREFITRTGEKYDAVLCFSQGCAVIASLILQHNNEHPEQPLPFKGIIFICGGMPLQILDTLGLPVSTAARDINIKSGLDLHKKAGAAASEIAEMLQATASQRREMRGLWDDTANLVHGEGASDPNQLPEVDPTNVYGLDFTRIPECLKISIPTVHIYGVKDPRYCSGVQLAHFCTADNRMVYDHRGGHEIPRTTAVSEKIADAVLWLESMIDKETD